MPGVDFVVGIYICGMCAALVLVDCSAPNEKDRAYATVCALLWPVALVGVLGHLLFSRIPRSFSIVYKDVKNKLFPPQPVSAELREAEETVNKMLES